jgi:hypothetical protein
MKPNGITMKWPQKIQFRDVRAWMDINELIVHYVCIISCVV